MIASVTSGLHFGAAPGKRTLRRRVRARRRGANFPQDRHACTLLPRTVSRADKGSTMATTTNTMRAIVQDSYGSADVLREARIRRPDIADNEVLVRVHAAGLDRGTWHLMTGKPYLQRPVTGLRRPRNPVSGRDVAGTVVAVGTTVTRF